MQYPTIPAAKSVAAILQRLEVFGEIPTRVAAVETCYLLEEEGFSLQQIFSFLAGSYSVPEAERILGLWLTGEEGDLPYEEEIFPTSSASPILPSRVSYTLLDDLKKCPLKDYLARKAIPSPSIAPLFGTAIHATLEHINRCHFLGIPIDSLSTLTDMYGSFLDKEIAKHDPCGMLPALVIECHKNGGKALLQAYLDRFLPFVQWTEEPEQKFTVEIPSDHIEYKGYLPESFLIEHIPDAQFRRNDQGRLLITLPTPIIVTGRYDARGLLSGIPTLVDFKTASHLWGKDREHSHFQASLYLLSEELLGKPVSDQFAYANFTLSDTDVALDIRITRRSPRERRLFLSGAQSVWVDYIAFQHARWYPSHPSSLCPYCGSQKTCGSGKAYMNQYHLSAQIPL